MVNIVTGQIAPGNVNVHQAVKIGKEQMAVFENSLPSGFYGTITKQVVTLNAAKKSIKVGGKDIYDVNLIYTRVLGLQQSRDVDLANILRHELSPLPTSIFKETGEMRIATRKSSLKQNSKSLSLADMSTIPT
jgi:predicted nucleic acid-binding protein